MPGISRMAKLLTRIWKAATGDFFETQEEALEAERKASLREACEAAIEAYQGPRNRAYQEAFTSWEKARDEFESQSHRHVGMFMAPRPVPPGPNIILPPKFLEALWKALEDKGLLVPLKLEPEE